MERTFVFGDIEDNEIAFNDVIECICSQPISTRYIFLGDIYTPKSPSLSIEHIARIMWELGIPIQQLINIDADAYTSCEMIKRAFSELRASKQVDIYTVNNKFRTGTVPNKNGIIPNDEVENMIKNELSYSSTESRVRFLLGNKEVDILKDLSNITNANIINNRFIGHFIYYKKHVRNESFLNFSIEELNILLNYLSLCHHFYYDAAHIPTMYQHIYTNARAISKYSFFPKISRIVAGHNRCFGRYKDSNLHAEIYMLDITHEHIDGVRNRLMLVGDKLYYFSSNKEVREMLHSRLSANRTFLKGGWGEDREITTLDFYLKSLKTSVRTSSVPISEHYDKSNYDSD